MPMVPNCKDVNVLKSLTGIAIVTKGVGTLEAIKHHKTPSHPKTQGTTNFTFWTNHALALQSKLAA